MKSNRLKIALFILIAPALACGFTSSEDEERELDPLITELGQIRVHVYRASRPLGPIALTCTGSDSRFEVGYRLELGSEDPVEFFDFISDSSPRRTLEGFEISRSYEAFRLEQCSRGRDTVFSVSDPDMPGRRWWVAFPLADGTIAIGGPRSLVADDCASAASEAPTLDTFLEGLENNGIRAACDAYSRNGHLRRGLACLLGSGETILERRSPLFEEVQTSAGAGELFALLRAGDFSEGVRSRRTLEELLLATPESLQREFLQERAEFCRAEPSSPSCGRWLMRALSRSAAELGAEECDSIVDLAATYLSLEGEPSAARATQALRLTLSCGSDDLLTATIRLALARHTASGLTNLAPCAGENALDPSSNCTSPPRIAGQWLALHCDDGSTALAYELITEERLESFQEDVNASINDPVFDGSMRVLAHCAPEQWTALFAGHPRVHEVRHYQRP